MRAETGRAPDQEGQGRREDHQGSGIGSIVTATDDILPAGEAASSTDDRSLWREHQHVYQAASSSADQLVPALERVIGSGHWRLVPHPMRGNLEFDSFADYCRGFLGIDVTAVETLLDASMFKAAAADVRRMIREHVQPVGKQGRPAKGGATTITHKDENDATYVLARLKRDRPDLAGLGLVGDRNNCSDLPHRFAGVDHLAGSAIQAGIRRKYLRVRADDWQQAAAVLARNYSAEQCRCIAESIGGAR